MAKFKDAEQPATIIRAWMANQGNVEFLKEWEGLNNTDFKPSQLRGFKGYERYVLEQFMKRTGSITCFIDYTNAKGLKVVRGKYGGTFAHSEIALQFANWMNRQPFYVSVIPKGQCLLLVRSLRN
ncbi:MAG: KilA-N domain-containing protein [Saprospiraceae bacterium]